MTVAIVVPTLGRHRKLRRFAKLIRATTPADAYELVFVTDAADHKTHQTLDKLGEGFVVYDGTYPQKVNAGIASTEHELLFITNDDVVFHPGWYEAATAKLTNGVGVVGTNDLHNADVLAGNYGTQLLVTREYCALGSIDNPNEVYHEGYWHNWCDVEFSETAQFRGAWAMAFDSHVEHFHPDHGLRKPDATDKRGQLVNREADEQLFAERRALWQR